MAPVTSKRRRDADEPRRPKKKVKKVKKQADYYSSSDDDDVPEGAAFDAPKVTRAPKVEEVVEPSGANSIEVAASRPKPILKRTVAVPKAVQEVVGEGDEEEEEDGDDDEEVDEMVGVGEGGNEIDEVARNTALNIQVTASDDEEEDLPESWPEDLGEDDEPDLTGASGSDSSDNGGSDLESETTSMTSSSTGAKQRKKRNDPTAFATSITRILASKLTTTKRSDPVLSRSASAAEANKSLANEKLENKARSQIRAERKAALQKGRVVDVLGLESEGVDTGLVVEEEKRLRKTAQRGVVKLFNAVRAAQVKGEEAGRVARGEGVVGVGKREERVSEMSKQGFLDLISSGGK